MKFPVTVTTEAGVLTLQIHLFSFCEHLIAPAASRTAGVVVLIPCLESTERTKQT